MGCLCEDGWMNERCVFALRLLAGWLCGKRSAPLLSKR